MRRSDDEELMDAVGVSDETLARSYRELHRVQTWLGNRALVLRRLQQDREPVRRVLDIGCGQGAMLLEVKKRLGVDGVGFDLRPAPAGSRVEVVCGNAVRDSLPRADVAISMMVAHHLSEADVVGLIRNVARSCRRFILLDLVRHPVPLALFRTFLSPLLCEINAADGQTSIRRAFTFQEMRRMVDAAVSGSGMPAYEVRHTMGPLWTRQVVDIRWMGGTSVKG